jgi:uncharacterized cofD-like protein
VTSVVAIGGGHGLAATVRACLPWADPLTAIVSVADDGGSSGRLRLAQPGLPAPGDLRRCLTALADPAHAGLAAALERRFDGGDLDGHPPGNVVLAALHAETGDLASAAATLGAALGVRATVLPATAEAVDLVGRRAPAGDEVFGQVAVECEGGSLAIRLEPEDPAVPAAALEAVAAADVVVLGPGSFLGSVLAAVGAPRLRAAVAAAPGRRVLVHNLFSVEPVRDRVAALQAFGVPLDAVLVATGTDAGDLGRVAVVVADIARPDGLAHDPERLGDALRALSSASEPAG